MKKKKLQRNVWKIGKEMEVADQAYQKPASDLATRNQE